MRKKKTVISISPYILCGILSILGVLMMILSSISFPNQYKWWEDWGAQTTNSVGTTLFAAALVSVFLEISNIKSLVREVLKNILHDDFPLDAYSCENLCSFHENIVANICVRENGANNFDKNKLMKSVYSLEPKMRESATDIFYSYHKCKYTITPDENHGVFRINANLNYKISNEQLVENAVVFKAKTYCINENNCDNNTAGKNNFKVEKFEINGKPVMGQYLYVDDIPEQTFSNYYDYKIRIEKKLVQTKKENDILLNYTYNVPIFDTTQSYKVVKPCKFTQHRFRILPDCETGAIWFLHADAFAAFYCKQDKDSKYWVEQNDDDLVKINFEDWVFPGSGYVVSMKKK